MSHSEVFLTCSVYLLQPICFGIPAWDIITYFPAISLIASQVPLRGSSVVECWTRNQVSPGSNPPWYRFEDWAFSFSPLTPLFTQLYK